MKEKIKIKKLILLTLIAIILTGCNGFPNGTLSQPEGKIILNVEQYSMIPGNYEWTEGDVEINTISSPDIYELAELFKTLEVKKGDTLKFKIDKNPSSITVTQINEDGTSDIFEIEDNKITMPSEGGYYIYELLTRWDKGKENFVFDVNVN